MGNSSCERRLLAAQAYANRLEDALWDCYKQAGADPDGMEAQEAAAAMRDFPKRCVDAVSDLRQDYDAQLDREAQRHRG